MDIFGTVISSSGLTGSAFFLCTAVSLGIGLFMAFVYSRSSHYSKSFLLTLALLPTVVQMVIMLVNGNIGAGVAVAGAFSLVRFRSAAGSGQEITGIFLSMASGLATGMGYLTAACIFVVILVIFQRILMQSPIGQNNSGQRILKITIPEELDYENLFDSILQKYTSHFELIEVRTTSMGSLYRLTYSVHLLPDTSTRLMMDEIRVRNGNLEVSCGRPVTPAESL